MTDEVRDLSDDILWGAAAIAAYVRRSERQVYYLISRGKLPATKLGPRTIVARKSELDLAVGQVNATNCVRDPANSRDLLPDTGPSALANVVAQRGSASGNTER